MTAQAKSCLGHWVTHYRNRDVGLSAACDALGRIIRCETEKLAFSVARYRRFVEIRQRLFTDLNFPMYLSTTPVSALAPLTAEFCTYPTKRPKCVTSFLP